MCFVWCRVVSCRAVYIEEEVCVGRGRASAVFVVLFCVAFRKVKLPSITPSVHNMISPQLPFTLHTTLQYTTLHYRQSKLFFELERTLSAELALLADKESVKYEYTLLEMDQHISLCEQYSSSDEVAKGVIDNTNIGT